MNSFSSIKNGNPKASGKEAAERKINIRTMKSDMEELLKTTKPSLIQILSEEAKKETARLPRLNLAPYKNLFAVGAVSLFLALAGLASYWFFPFRAEPAPETPRKIIAAPPLFAVESARTIETGGLDRVRFLTLINDSFRERERPGTVKRIIIKVTDGAQERFATVKDFFSFYKISPPQNILAELNSEPMFFFYYGDGGTRFGMAARAKSGDRIFRDALFWEEKMALDLRPLLFSEETPQQNFIFEDKTYRNIDWRFLKLFPERDLGIAYTAFPARNVFVLTTGKESMEVVISRLFDVR